MLGTLNEIGQWATIVVILVLVVGIYRQLAVALGHAGSPLSANTGPAVGRRLPKGIMNQLQMENERNTVVFVSQSCRACQRLLSTLTTRSPAVQKIGLLFHEGSSRAFQDAIEQIAGTYGVVVSGQEWKECRVNTTPIVCVVDRDGRVVDRRVSHSLDELEGTGSAA